MNSEKKIFIALSLYLTALIASNTLGIKLMPFLFGSHLSAAIFVFPIVFLMTDVIGEVFGKEMSKRFVKMGFLLKRQEGSHVFFQHSDGRTTVVPNHPGEK